MKKNRKILLVTLILLFAFIFCVGIYKSGIVYKVSNYIDNQKYERNAQKEEELRLQEEANKDVYIEIKVGDDYIVKSSEVGKYFVENIVVGDSQPCSYYENDIKNDTYFSTINSGDILSVKDCSEGSKIRLKLDKEAIK